MKFKIYHHCPRGASVYSSVTVITLFSIIFINLSGCMTVGPDYVKIEPKAANNWSTRLEGGLNTDSQDPKTMVAWWKALNDPELSSIEKRAVKGNLELKTARSRIREARAVRGISGAKFFPLLNAGASAEKYDAGENNGNGSENSLYKIGFDAGWELDVFGGIRRLVEAADAKIEVAQNGLHDALVTLQAEVAMNYVEVRTFQRRLTIAETNIRTQKQILELNRSRRKAGLISELAVQESLYALEHTRSLIPGLQTGLEAAKNRLAILLGETPGSVHGELKSRRLIPVPPAAIAVGVPAETLRRRPDIRQAERNLAAMTAGVGVATADLYPKFRLLGTIGLESISSGDLLTADSRAWSFGPGISWNIFHAGALRQKIKLQSIRQEQSLIQYEKTVLKALEEVENILTAYAKEQQRKELLRAATNAATLAYELSVDLYKAGLVDFDNVLTTQSAMQSLQDKLALSKGSITLNFISLYKALGGGWM